MRLISNNELGMVSGGDYGDVDASGQPWDSSGGPINMPSSFGGGDFGGGDSKSITITTSKGCEDAYPVPQGKEWQNECKKAVALADAGAGVYPIYNPNWNKKP